MRTVPTETDLPGCSNVFPLSTREKKAIFNTFSYLVFADRELQL